MKASERARLVIPAGAVVCRPWRSDDLPWLYEACQDAEIQRWTLVPRPYLPRHAVEFVALATQRLIDGVEYHLCIAGGESDAALGSIGVTDVSIERAEIGYWLSADGRGRGAASAAVMAVAEWCERELRVDETCLRIAPGNTASIAVALRCGYGETDRQRDACRDGDAVADALVFTRRAVPAR